MGSLRPQRALSLYRYTIGNPGLPPRLIIDTHPHPLPTLNSYKYEPLFFSRTIFDYDDPHKPPFNPRALQFGDTVRTLHKRLPTVLQSSLPADILNAQVELRLFPSTHPHLPAVRGRLAYTAALCTAPMAWGRVPLVGNVRLSILSEQLIKQNAFGSKGGERLVVKWRTSGRAREIGPDKDEFTGIFIFTFDEDGRIGTHVIEHAEESKHYDRMKVISVTDWLLSQMVGRPEPSVNPV